ncbi:MAG: protein-tyrosine-phosphatase [Planctomycetota bacterium]
MTIEWITPELAAFLTIAEKEELRIPQERQGELRHVAEWIAGRLAAGQPAELVFICTHNSRRSHFSQIWAAIAAFGTGLDAVRTFSGGTEVTAMNERVADSLRRSGLVVNAENPAEPNPRFQIRFAASQPPLVCFSKIFHHPPNPQRDYCAVMTCSHADDACPVVPGCSLRVPVRYTDPKVADGTADEARVYDERSREICREMLYLMRMAGAAA